MDCPVCFDHIFTSAAAWNEHARVVHEGLYPHYAFCETCRTVVVDKRGNIQGHPGGSSCKILLEFNNELRYMYRRRYCEACNICLAAGVDLEAHYARSLLHPLPCGACKTGFARLDESEKHAQRCSVLQHLNRPEPVAEGRQIALYTVSHDSEPQDVEMLSESHVASDGTPDMLFQLSDDVFGLRRSSTTPSPASTLPLSGISDWGRRGSTTPSTRGCMTPFQWGSMNSTPRASIPLSLTSNVDSIGLSDIARTVHTFSRDEATSTVHDGGHTGANGEGPPDTNYLPDNMGFIPEEAMAGVGTSPPHSTHDEETRTGESETSRQEPQSIIATYPCRRCTQWL